MIIFLIQLSKNLGNREPDYIFLNTSCGINFLAAFILRRRSFVPDITAHYVEQTPFFRARSASDEGVYYNFTGII